MSWVFYLLAARYVEGRERRGGCTTCTTARLCWGEWVVAVFRAVQELATYEEILGWSSLR